MKIAVALSGGVDSTTAAKRLQAAGHEVIGLTLRLCPDISALPQTRKTEALARPGLAEHGCATCVAPCACVDGREAARRLGIQHEILDVRSEFESQVIGPFIADYSAGLTPNPCAQCNRGIKFGSLLDRARQIGADVLATGHYAGVKIVQGSAQIWRAQDAAKDQTYFLALVPQSRFRHVWFPLSADSKTQVLAEAGNQGLMDARTETSNEICFLREHTYTDFLKLRRPQAFVSGDIVDTSGRKLGEHHGLPFFTIGQRRGLGVAARHPLFVVRVDQRTQRVVVGRDEDLWTRKVRLWDINWPDDVPRSPCRVQAMIRYRQTPMPAQLEFTDAGACLTFDQPIRAVTPGQIAAMYAEGRLLGGGRILATEEGQG